MGVSRRHRLLVLVPLLWTPLLLAASPTTLPSIDELQKMLDEKQYHPLVQQLSKLLAMKQEATPGLDRARLLLLKGEAHLQLKDGGRSAAAFTDAAGVAKEPKDKARAIATAYLVKKSPAFEYKQQTGEGAKATPPTKFDIVTDRNAAMEALLRDELETIRPRVERARESARTLPQLLDVLKMVEPLSATETTLRGEATESPKLLAGLDDRAAALMSGALADMEKQMTPIRQRASETERVINRDWNAKSTYRSFKTGITSSDYQTITTFAQTCEKIKVASDELTPILNAKGDAFAQVKSQAQALIDETGKLRTEYDRQRTRKEGFVR